jgi:26S proteasome regulatory subunit N6
MAQSLQQKLQSVDEVVDAGQQQAQLKDIILGSYPNDAESIKVKEQAIGKLAELLVKQQDAAALASLLTELRPLFNAIPKAKTAKLVRTIIDSIAKVPNSSQLQVCGGSPASVALSSLRPCHRRAGRCAGCTVCVDATLRACCSPCVQLDVCKEQVAWATSEKRTFLRQRIEIR